MSAITVNGVSLEYLEYGAGEPLVFVHGSASDYRTWHEQQQELAKRYRVITYSRRYHWPNDPIPSNADYAMMEQVEDLHALLRSLGSGTVHLVGHSYGAFLCLLLAIKEPNLVRTLTLAEPPVITLFVGNTPKPSEILKLLASRPRTAFALLKFGAQGIAPARVAAQRGDVEQAMRIFGKAVLGRRFFDALSEPRMEQVLANAIQAEFLGSGFPALSAEQLSILRVPTLLIGGQYSPRLFHRLLDALEEFLPHTERIEIEGASHIMHEDNTPAYNDVLQSFLAKHGGAA